MATIDQTPGVGVGEEHTHSVADGLARVLADTFSLYLKTHGYHWNVQGPLFPELHALFNAQYDELWEAVDLIAERIRALGALAPFTYSRFYELTSVVQDVDDEPQPAAGEMVRRLLDGHEAVIRCIRDVRQLADAAGDFASITMLDGRLQVHEKAAWMLRSTAS